MGTAGALLGRAASRVPRRGGVRTAAHPAWRGRQDALVGRAALLVCGNGVAAGKPSCPASWTLISALRLGCRTRRGKGLGTALVSSLVQRAGPTPLYLVTISSRVQLYKRWVRQVGGRVWPSRLPAGLQQHASRRPPLGCLIA